ncbi:MAG TPA: polysaccharide deacetylase family protein [Flavobacterium sp.]|nr:polysaccharide deacetylase family protein [Flavobacterium sp.]
MKRLFSRYIWDMPKNDKTVYLTFDDGPTPEITEWVLSQLESFGAKATFFCIGNNIEKHPEIFEKVIESGHSIGNHTFNHVNGWHTKTEMYMDDVAKCAATIENNGIKTNLFRPPYGKLSRKLSRLLRDSGYKIIMWDILSADFDQSITPEKCLENVLKNISPGSIIIFHDSMKAFRNLKNTLPKTLEFLAANGYSAAAIELPGG